MGTISPSSTNLTIHGYHSILSVWYLECLNVVCGRLFVEISYVCTFWDKLLQTCSNGSRCSGPIWPADHSYWALCQLQNTQGNDVKALRHLSLTLVLLRYFFVTRPLKRRIVATSSQIFYTVRLIPYLLPVYWYGLPLSIDTKTSTIELHMTSLWRHKLSPLGNLDTLKIYVKISKNQFFVKNRRNMRFSLDFWLNM